MDQQGRSVYESARTVNRLGDRVLSGVWKELERHGIVERHVVKHSRQNYVWSDGRAAISSRGA